MGRGAKIFLLSALISSCVFGLISYIIISAVADGSKPATENADVLTEGAVSEKYSEIGSPSFNTLFVIRKDEKLLCAVLVRTDKDRGEITYTPIPANTVVPTSDGSRLLSALYESDKTNGLVQRIKTITGITVDYTFTITPADAALIADIIGEIDFTVSTPVLHNGVSVSGGAQKLNGEKIEAMLLYYGYDTSEQHRENVTAGLLRELIKKFTKPENRSTGLELYVKINVVADTDFTVEEYSKEADLIFKINEFNDLTIGLSGNYAENGIFNPDIDKTLNEFENYRKYYN